MPYFWLPSVAKYLFKIQPVFLSTMLLTGSLVFKQDRVLAQKVLSCSSADGSQSLINQAIANYALSQGEISSNRLQIDSAVNSNAQIAIAELGIANEAGTLNNALGIIGNGLTEVLKQQGFNDAEANLATITTLAAWVGLPATASSAEVVAAVKQSLIEKFGVERQESIEQISDSLLLTTLAGLQPSVLKALNLSTAEIKTLGETELTPETDGSFSEQIQSVTATAISSLERPEAKNIITETQAQAELELENIRQGKQTTISTGDILNFRFRLDNLSAKTANIEIQSIADITKNNLIGAGRVTAVKYRLAEAESANTVTEATQVSIPGGQTLNLAIQVKVGELTEDGISPIGINLRTDCSNLDEVEGSDADNPNNIQTFNIVPNIVLDNNNPLIDPRGQISGCAGELLADYLGFSVGLYDVDLNDPTESEPNGVTPLTATELPDDPDNDIAAGIEPNIQNSNPFFLTNEDEGKYSFLFDENRGQLDKGRNYILIVDPGENSIYNQRRVKITIGDRQDRVVEYTATSLDGRPISAQSDETTVTGQIVLVEDAERVGLNLAVLDLATNICDAQEITLTKTSDRATAEPGDIVLYRLTVRNLASVPLTDFQVVDTLPAGFNLMDESIMAEANSQEVEIATIRGSDRVVNFTANTTLEQGQTLNLVYAAQITPDAVRGSAENSAIVNAQRTDNNFTVKDGPAIHNLRLEPGIMRDSGTLIGRVFVDKNFDGEQQAGEPGIPNAVIYLENGNRIITDADGLFSVANVLPGYHTGILDLTTIPEYRLAPNLRFSESNSNSRLVNLEPGGLVRMNFGVTPTAEGKADEEKTNTPSRVLPPTIETPEASDSNNK